MTYQKIHAGAQRDALREAVKGLRDKRSNVIKENTAPGAEGYHVLSWIVSELAENGYAIVKTTQEES